MKIKSFTLIELMAVVSIIAILAGIVVYGINDWKDDTNLKKIIAYSNEIKSKLGFSLIAEWKMEGGDSDTDIYDSGRLGITGRIEGGVDKVVNCPEGDKCIHSKGAKIHFYEPVPILKFKTICFWIKSINTSSEILHNANDFKIYSNNGVVTFDVYSANDTFISVPFTGTTINDNKWHFICGSINNDSVFYGIFDDGIKVVKSVDTTNFGRMSLNNMCLGCDVNSEFYLDDLVFFEETIEKSSVASNEINKPSNLSLAFSDIGADNVNASIFFMHGGENCNIVLNCVEDGTSNFTGTITETKITNTTSETTSTYQLSNLLGNKKYVCTANVSNSVGSVSISNNFTTIAPINGSCGTANKTYAYDVNTYGTDTFCSSGTASPASPAFPAQGESVSWTCIGSNGGTNASCTAKRNAPVNGACGTANKTYAYNVVSYGTDTFCSSGVANPVSPAFPAQGGSTTWTCEGLNGGTSASCIATRSLAPVNGACGTANKTYAYGATNYGTDTFCSSGTANPTSPAFPAQGGSTTWTCTGKNGGTSASCTAKREGVLGFTKRTAITISNSGSALTNYQIKLGIPFFSGMQADFDDIRFTSSNGSTLLNYWIEDILGDYVLIDDFVSGETWTENQITGSASGGNYVAQITNTSDPFFYKNVDSFNPSYNRLVMRYKSYVNGPRAVGLYYADNVDCSGYCETCVQHNIPIISDGEWHTLYADINDAEWINGNGNINKIRIDFESIPATGTVYIDSIKFMKSTTATANIWAKIPSIPNGNSTIYLYYGNSSAISASNGDNTFEFFDDFDGATINTTKWNIVNNTGFSVSNGQLRGTNTTGRITSKATFNPGVVLDIKNYRTGTLAPNGYGIGGFWLSTSNGMGFLDHPGNLYYRNDGTWVNQGKEAPGNVWRKASIIVPNSTQTILNMLNLNTGETIWSPGTLANAVSSEPISLGQRQDGAYANQSYDAYWEWILVRKYASTEPTTPSQFAPKNPINSTLAYSEDFEGGVIPSNFTHVNTWNNGHSRSIASFANPTGGAKSLNLTASNGIGYQDVKLPELGSKKIWTLEYWAHSSASGYGYTDIGITVVNKNGANMGSIGANDNDHRNTFNSVFMSPRPAGVWSRFKIVINTETGSVDHLIYNASGTLLASNSVVVNDAIGATPDRLFVKVRGYSVTHTIHYDDISLIGSD